MPRLSVTVALAALALAGCGERVRQTTADPPRPEAVAVPYELTGTWVESDDPGAAASGFLVLGQHRVVFNLHDLPRAVAVPTGGDVEAGLGAGRLSLDNGMQLFVARGQSARNLGAGMVLCDHLDVDLVRADGSTAMHRRLWNEVSLRLAAQATAVAATVRVPPPSPPASAPAVAPGTDGLLNAAPGGRRTDAEELLRLASAGASASTLAATYGACQRRAWAAALGLIEQARSDPGQAGTLLARSASAQREAEAFAAAVAGWKP